MDTNSYIQEQEIILRAVEPSDLDFLYLAENDRQAWSNAATVAPMSRMLLQHYIEQYTADIYSDRQLRLIAIHSSTGERLGIVDLYDFDPRNSRSGVGIYIVPAARCKGYGKLSLLALCHYAQTFLGIHNLYAVIAEDNAASIALFQSCHFTTIASLPHWIKTNNGFTCAIMMQRIK